MRDFVSLQYWLSRFLLFFFFFHELLVAWRIQKEAERCRQCRSLDLSEIARCGWCWGKAVWLHKLVGSYFHASSQLFCLMNVFRSHRISSFLTIWMSVEWANYLVQWQHCMNGTYLLKCLHLAATSALGLWLQKSRKSQLVFNSFLAGCHFSGIAPFLSFLSSKLSTMWCTEMFARQRTCLWIK